MAALHESAKNIEGFRLNNPRINCLFRQRVRLPGSMRLPKQPLLSTSGGVNKGGCRVKQRASVQFCQSIASKRNTSFSIIKPSPSLKYLSHSVETFAASTGNLASQSSGRRHNPLFQSECKISFELVSVKISLRVCHPTPILLKSTSAVLSLVGFTSRTKGKSRV